ncbi:hypothetical protein N0B31_10300 [Salinirubellus salinus]|uniref:Uncharacterized protein n=1 Tax=Salinirubellus salinus TaxID=1364945 RepID=A0A9E7R724_9EURY|nr:hypothetical protein [Salinirubellus salinus]UWM56666.1 hypothetical protein N0B31_10300 [Salinirubellus salinus]
MTSKNTEERTRDTESGRFESEISKEQVRMAVMAHADEPMTTSDVHDTVGGSRRTVLHYLQQLAENDEISVRKPSENYALWSRPKHVEQENDVETDGGTHRVDAVSADEFQF